MCIRDRPSCCLPSCCCHCCSHAPDNQRAERPGPSAFPRGMRCPSDWDVERHVMHADYWTQRRAADTPAYNCT
eukprot:6808462-Alexandrium_andersonii.AAC.1